VLLVEHDITFTLHRQLAELNHDIGAHREHRRWLAFEREALQCSNSVWTMSGHDRRMAVEHGALPSRAEIIPNGVDLRRFQPSLKPSGPPTVLFVGSFRHLPNLLAFEALRESIMPEVWRRIPDAVLHVIAGPQHERAVELANTRDLLAAHSGIEIEGLWRMSGRPIAMPMW
jgi:glycosyltransferase involved in cell wall biosynthesis